LREVTLTEQRNTPSGSRPASRRRLAGAGAVWESSDMSEQADPASTDHDPKDAMREALERKQQANKGEGGQSGAGGPKMSGGPHRQAGAKRQFRRKSGG